MKRSALLAALLVLSSSAFAWNSRTTVDEMTDDSLTVLFQQSDNAVNLGPIYGLQHAWLAVSDKGAIVTVQKANLVCFDHSDCHLAIRVDDQPVRTFKGTSGRSRSFIGLPPNAREWLTSQLPTAKAVRIEIEQFGKGRIVYRFNAEGFEEMRERSRAK